MDMKKVKMIYRKDKYRVVTEFDQDKLPIMEQATIEIFDTKRSTKDEGYRDCSWLIVAFIDEGNKVVYLSEGHDGVIVEGIRRIHAKACNIHKGITLSVYNAKITHRGGDFWVECSKNKKKGEQMSLKDKRTIMDDGYHPKEFVYLEKDVEESFEEARKILEQCIDSGCNEELILNNFDKVTGFK